MTRAGPTKRPAEAIASGSSLEGVKPTCLHYRSPLLLLLFPSLEMGNGNWVKEGMWWAVLEHHQTEGKYFACWQLFFLGISSLEVHWNLHALREGRSRRGAQARGTCNTGSYGVQCWQEFYYFAVALYFMDIMQATLYICFGKGKAGMWYKIILYT